MSRWTYIAQRAITREFLHWDLPIEITSQEWELSGSGALTGTVAPDVGGLRDASGRLVLEEWGTILYAEADGLIRWAGLVVSCSFEGETWSVECAGLSTYPHSVIYRGELSEVGIDPAAAFSLIWEHLQSFPDSDLGVSVIGDTTPIRLGTPPVAEVVPVPLQAAEAIRDRFSSGQPIAADWNWDDSPDAVRQSHAALVQEFQSTQNQAPAWLQIYADTHPSSTEKTPAALAIRDRMIAGQPLADDWSWDGCPSYVSRWGDELVSDYHDSQDPAKWLETYLDDHADERVAAKDAEPYTLLWWESPNCGEELDSLAKTAPLDWVEEHRWADDREDVVHEIRLGYPRLGARRSDIVFIQDENVLGEPVTVESNGDDFANSIIGLGAGEGQAMLRRETAVRDGRLRRDYVYADKAVTDSTRLDALIDAELAARKAALRVTSLSVVDHVNAPIGSWQLGDDVLLRFTVPWLGEVEIWVRITGWALTGEHTATLTVSRSDLFRYGG